MRATRCALITILVAMPLAAQTTWTVSNNDDLTPYIAQAAPGDTLLLGAAHPGFVLTKGLTLRPASGRTTITALSAPIGLSSDVQIPAGQQAFLLHLDFTNSGWTPWWTGGHPVTVAGVGVAGFEDCTFRSFSTFAGYAVQVSGGAVTMRNCVMTGLRYATGLQLQSGLCSLVDCQLFGSHGVSQIGANDEPPMAAAIVNGGTLVASQSTLTPGTATVASLGYPVGPAAGLQIVNGTALLTDCTIRGGDYPIGVSVPPPYTGASAIRVLGGAASHARCTLQPGNGTPPGSPTTGNAIVDANLVGIASSGALPLGTTWTVTATASASGQPLGFAFWFGLAPTSAAPLVPEPVWGAPAQATLLNFTLPAAGNTVPFAIAIPNTPSLVDSELWAQAIQLALPLVRASALAGGVLH